MRHFPPRFSESAVSYEFPLLPARGSQSPVDCRGLCVTHTGSRLTGFPKSAHAPYYSRCPKPSAAPAICPRAALGELGQSFTEGDYAEFLQQVNEVGAFRRTSETPSPFRSGSSGCVLEGFQGHQCPQNYFFRRIYFKLKSHISKHSSPDFVLSLFSIDLMPFSLIHPPE